MRRIRISVNNQIFAFVFLILLFFTVLILFIQHNTEKAYKKEQLNEILNIYNRGFYALIQEDGLSQAALDNFMHWLPDTLIRISVMDASGNLVLDSEFDFPAGENNHADRPEFIKAREHGSGESIRYSETAKLEYYYYAQHLGDYYIRSALPFDVKLSGMLTAFNKEFLIYILILFVVIVLCVWLMSRVLHKVFIQLKELAGRVYQNGSFSNKKYFFAGELQDVSAYIEKNYKELEQVKDELQLERDRLFNHLRISQEGLAIFSSDQKCIVVNELFIQYINLIASSSEMAPEDVLVLDEFADIRTFILDKSSKNKASNSDLTTKVSASGRSFSVKCIVLEDLSFEISINEISQIEQQSRLKKQLTENIAHELRTPVSSISAYLETIIRNPDIPEERTRLFIERSYAQSLRLSNIVNDILLLNRLDAESELFVKETLNLREIIDTVIDDNQIKLEEKQITLTTNLPESIPINGNRFLFYAIFGNLLDNSLHYAGDNITINIQLYREDESMYYFSYADTGIGIPAEHLTRIFERFYRLDKGRSRKLGGTGLGLSIVKNAILIHNGNIFAKKPNEGGIEFLFTLSKD